MTIDDLNVFAIPFHAFQVVQIRRRRALQQRGAILIHTIQTGQKLCRKCD